LDEVRQLLHPSHISLLTLQTLIDNLLESGSIEANRFRLRLRPFHIHEALENALNIARPLLERRQQPLSVTEPPHLPPMVGDPARLTQVLLNLLVNASKYSDIGAPIEVRLAHREGWLQVEVADRGPGIPPEEGERLFASFVRLGGDEPEQYGVGLGLFVVRTIVTAHGGKVGVHGRVGGGSLFWLELPLVPPQEQEVQL
jgi:signal transduction histidine kinase